jgi:DNA-binding NarL/FixJ family response regulator
LKTNNKIRVILADDHVMVRQGIRRILEKDSQIQIIGESGTGMGAIHLVHELKPDVLLLDIEMPDMTGHDVARQLRSSNCAVTILVLSACDDDHFIKETLKTGIDGYLSKSESPANIRRAVYQFSARRNPLFMNL